MAGAPVLETARLRLRGRTLDDFPWFAALWSNPEVTRYIGGAPQDEETTWTKFLRMVGHWSVMGFGYWAVEERQTGALVGDVGFGDFRRAITPPMTGELEAGWVLDPAAHGKGYAKEALDAALAWAALHFPEARISCIIDPANAPSLRLAGKCGFRQTARTSYHGAETLVMHRG